MGAQPEGGGQQEAAADSHLSSALPGIVWQLIARMLYPADRAVFRATSNALRGDVDETWQAYARDVFGELREDVGAREQ